MANLLRTFFEIHNRGGGSAGGPQIFMESSAGELQAVQELTSSLQRLDQQGVRTYSELSRSSQKWSGMATRAATQVIALLTHQNLVDQQSMATHRLAEQAKSASTLVALKQLAPVRAIMQTAAGLADLGDFNFWGAAQHFASAALYGTIAGAQIAASANAGSSRSRTLSEHYAHGLGSGPDGNMGEPVSTLAAGVAGAAHPPSGNLTIAIMGEPEAGQWLATTLNTAVQERGVQLTASNTIRSPYAAG